MKFLWNGNGFLAGFFTMLLWACSAFALPLGASPITYTESLGGSSGKLGSVTFANAILFLTFQGDTTNVVPFSVPLAAGFEILTGAASVQVMDSASGAVLAQGTFLPAARIFVSVDYCSPHIHGLWLRGTFPATLTALKGTMAYFPATVKITDGQSFEANGTLVPDDKEINPISEDLSLQFGTFRSKYQKMLSEKDPAATNFAVRLTALL